MKTPQIVLRTWAGVKKLKTVSTKKGVLIGVAVVVVFAAVVYEVVVPQIIGNNYKRQFKPAAASYTSAINKLVDSTMRPIFTNPDSTPKSDQNDLTIVKNTIADSVAAQKLLVTDANKLKNLPLSGYFGSYKQAKQLKTAAANIANDNEKIIGKYNELAVFMGQFNIVALKLQDNMTALNTLESLTDINKLIDALNGLKQVFLDTATETSLLNEPFEFTKIKADSVAALTEMANGFEAMATATLNLDLAGITDASKIIDSATAKIDDVNKVAQKVVSQDSALMKSIKALSATTAALTF